MNPYRRPELSDEAREAIEEAVRFNGEIAVAEIKRDNAIRRALGAGASLRVINAEIQLSTEKIRQLGKTTEERVAIDQQQGDPTPTDWVTGAIVKHAGRQWRIDQMFTRQSGSGGLWTWILVREGSI